MRDVADDHARRRILFAAAATRSATRGVMIVRLTGPGNKKPPDETGGPLSPQQPLLLLLTFAVGLLAVLAGILRVLLGVGRMFLALGVVAFAVLFRRGAVRLGGVFVMLSGFIVFVSSHEIPPIDVAMT